ncbi:lipase family protein [Pseudomonas nitroreducens]|uniref:lipase family protein n=1 Tax=Pseudomonas nitroreducens TaxID=46680 RepID=UPI002D80DD3A|nr:lipase family protein [Pseudomonas nitroreducens]
MHLRELFCAGKDSPSSPTPSHLEFPDKFDRHPLSRLFPSPFGRCSTVIGSKHRCYGNQQRDMAMDRNDTTHRTDTLCPNKDVLGCPQIQHWVEIQLLDEHGEALPYLPYRARNDATRAGVVPEYRGQANAEGVIQIEGLHPIPLTLFIDADPLAEVLQTRRLRAKRAEPKRPIIGDPTPLHSPQRQGYSPVEAQATAAGHEYHHVRIGQLCDKLPRLDPPLPSGEPLPAYHFPDEKFGGYTLGSDVGYRQPYEHLDRRHVLEVCPFRAWVLVLHHQRDYSLVTAYNLGLMSVLAYSTYKPTDYGSVQEFFERQCLDLSRTPRVRDGYTNPPCVVTDVPFSERYTNAKPLDTAAGETPEGNTQLFYAISASQVLVGWRGTEMNFPFPDLATDVTFRPVKPEVQGNCEPKVPCADLTPRGSVHLGFRDAYEVARRLYSDALGKTIQDEGKLKELFICGHSLGGALGLIHAASLKDLNPLLYTYGMPRTFTLQAVACLEGVRHFRHVNDTDLIPEVPPEADLDNVLYKLYGPLGTTLGTVWSVGQLLADPVIKGQDPFCHHGEIAAFYQTNQHVQVRGSDNPFYKSREGLGAPYHTRISRTLRVKAKLFVVPSLSETDDEQARAAQQRYTTSLTPEARDRYFPKGRNAKRGNLLGIRNHFMGKYQPYIYGQLVESINPSRMQERQEQRRQLEAQMVEFEEKMPEDELVRDRLFLSLQNLVGTTLACTRQSEGGPEALERFEAVAEDNLYVEMTHG